jgi:4-hydroxybenzoyl-CoA thioesterase
MGKAVVHTVQVEFGDCDPARIVWFPNFFRWIDAASRNFFVHCGVPAWHVLEKSHGIIGTPLVDTQARFVNTASYGDTLDIHTRIAEWRAKSFVQHYRVVRADTLVMECTEVRIFATRRGGSETGIRAVAVPADLRALCD